MKRILEHTRGLTLVQTLVVVGVIAVLAAIALPNLNEARQTARDKERIAHLETMRTALRLYKDQFGRYPEAGCGTGDACWIGHSYTGGGGTCTAACTDYIDMTNFDQFITNLPVDARAAAQRGYMYRTNATQSEYKFMVFGTVENTVVSAPGAHEYASMGQGCDPTGFTAVRQSSFAVSSPGASCW